MALTLAKQQHKAALVEELKARLRPYEAGTSARSRNSHPGTDPTADANDAYRAAGDWAKTRHAAAVGAGRT